MNLSDIKYGHRHYLKHHILSWIRHIHTCSNLPKSTGEGFRVPDLLMCV